MPQSSSLSLPPIDRCKTDFVCPLPSDVARRQRPAASLWPAFRRSLRAGLSLALGAASCAVGLAGSAAASTPRFRPICEELALPPELAFVVQPRRVIKADRPDRYQLIRFRHRVGRRPRFVGNNRHLLPDDTVQKRRLSRVAVADNRHRQPHPRRYVCIQFCSHSRRPFVKIVFSPPVACAPLSPSPSPGACAPSSPAPGTSRAVPASAFFHSRQPASALSKSTRSSRSGSTMPFLCRSVNRTVSGA